MLNLRQGPLPQALLLLLLLLLLMHFTGGGYSCSLGGCGQVVPLKAYCRGLSPFLLASVLHLGPRSLCFNFLHLSAPLFFFFHFSECLLSEYICSWASSVAYFSAVCIFHLGRDYEGDLVDTGDGLWGLVGKGEGIQDHLWLVLDFGFSLVFCPLTSPSHYFFSSHIFCRWDPQGQSDSKSFCAAQVFCCSHSCNFCSTPGVIFSVSLSSLLLV